MKEHITCQRLYGLILMLRFIFLSEALSLKGKRLDFYGRADTYVSLTNTVPELSRFTACIDLVFVDDKLSDWMAFSYVTNNAFLGREDIDLGLGGDHQQLILYNLGKTFYIRYHLTPFQWHTVCLMWDGVKGRLELFLNSERILVMMDQPQNLTPNGTLMLGRFLTNWNSQVESALPGFTGSLYYFQLWDHILENEEFLKCVGGNVVSWEEDVWLISKIVPTVDTRLRCFVSENITIQEMSTTLSQQRDLTTPSQVTGLKPQETIYSSTMMLKSMPVFATDYTTISYSNTTSPPLETMTTPKFLKTSIAETTRFVADILSTLAAITLPTKSTSIGTTTNSMKITKSPTSDSTRTTKMAEAIGTETFHPTTATDFLHTSGLTKNSVISNTSVTGSQSTIMKTPSLFSSAESIPISTTSWPKHKSTGIDALSISTASQEFLASTAAGTVPWSMAEETSATSTHAGTASASPPESVLNSTVAPVDSVFPRNQTASTLATTDMEIASPVHSKTLPTRPIETMPVLTAEAELTSTNFQDVSSPRMEDTISTSIPMKASSVALSFRTPSPFTGAQSTQPVLDAETTHAALTLGVTLAPTAADTLLPPITPGPVYTQNTPTGGGNMLPLNSTSSASTVKASESGPTSITGDGAHLFSTNETTWTPRADQTLWTSAFHGSASNAGHSSTTSTTIIPPGSASESEATAVTDVGIPAGATTERYATALPTMMTSWFANFSMVLGTTSVTKLPEFKLTTLRLKTTPLPTAAGSELLSTPRETFVPPVDRLSTLADLELKVSTEESASETTLTETNGTTACGETTAPVPESTTPPRCNGPETRTETTSRYLEGKSTLQVTAELSPFATTLEATEEAAQMVTASVTISPFPDVEKWTTPLDNKTTTTEVRGSWLSTKSMKTTSKSSYDGTTEIFNSTHTHTAHQTSEAPPPEGNPTPPPISGSTHTFPEPPRASTTRVLGTSFATVSTDMTVMSLSAGIWPPRPTATLSSAAPVPSPKVTPASVSPLDQTASTTGDTVPTHRHSIPPTSEATVFSVRVTPMTVPSLTETPVPLWRPPTPVATEAKTTFLFTSADTVTPFTPTLVCSKSPPNNIPVVSSTHVISTMFTPVATQPISQGEETSSHALSLPYTLSSSGDVVSSAPSSTETSAVDETVPLHTSADKLTVDGHISQSSTGLGNTLVPTLSVTDISALSSDKEQMTTSPGNTSRTMKVTEISPSENPCISDSPSTSSLEMTDTGFAETTTISSHQTHSPSEFPLGTPPDRISASSPPSGTLRTTPTSISSHIVDAHIPEMSTSLGKTALPSQPLTITTFLSPEKESVSALSIYTPRTEKMIVSATSVTHPFSYHQDTSFADTVTSRTTRISNPVNVNTTLSYLLSPKTQTKVTSVASPISESTQTSPESLSLSTTRLSSANFTVISTDGITTALSAPNAPTALQEKTSVATSTPTYQMSSLPVRVTAFSSKRVSDTPTIAITKSSKTAHPDGLKSPSIATSGPMSEMPSMSVNGSSLSPPAVSFATSTKAGSFSSLLSSTTPRTTMTLQTSTLDVTPGPTSKSSLFSSASITSGRTKVPSRITPTSISSLTQPTFPSVKTIPTTVMAGMATPSVGTTAFSLLGSRNTEAISSIPKTTFSPFQSTTRQSSQRDETTTLGVLSGTANGSFSPGSSSTVTTFTNTYSRTAALEHVLSSTLSDNLHTSLTIQVSPSLTSFKSTPGSTKRVKATTYLSSNTENMTSLSENTSAAELTKGATSVGPPVSYTPRTPSVAMPPSLTSFIFSPRSPEAKFSTSETFFPLTSRMVEFPVLGTRITSGNTQSLLMTSWNTPTAKGSQFPISTTTHISTPRKMEAETPYLVPGSLSTFTASQTGLVSGDVMAKSSLSTSGILPTLGMSDSPSSPISSRSTPITLADIKHTFEKKATSVTPGTTLAWTPSGATSGSILSEATSSSMLAWILSTFPSGSPLATVSSTPHVITSSPEDVSKSAVLTSDATPAHSFTNFTTLPFAAVSAALTQTTPPPTVGSITTGFPTSLPMSINITVDSAYMSQSPEASSRTTVTAKSRSVSQPQPLSRMSRSPPATDHAPSVSPALLPSPVGTSAWSRIPAASASPTLVLPKPTLDSLPNITTTMLTAPTTSFPFTSTGLTHPSTATVSSLLSSSSETTRLDSTPSFLSRETATSLAAAVSTVSFYNIEMSFSVFDEKPRIPITSVVKEFAENWLNSIFQDSEFALANLSIQVKTRDTSEGEITMDQTVREGQGMATISRVPSSYVCHTILKASSSLAAKELISRIKSKIHGNLTHGNFTQGQLTLFVRSEHVVVKKLEPGRCEAQETVSKYKGTYKWLLTNPTDTAQTRCIKNRHENATRLCSISINTGKSQWEKPKLKQCKLLQGLPDKIVDLANITISDENVDDVAEHVLNLINESPTLDEEETKIIVSKVSDISRCDEISMNLTQIILQIINALLGKQNNSASDLHEVRNEILRIIERAGHKMEFSGRTANLTAARLALAVLRVDHAFEGMAFGIRSLEEGADPEIYLGEAPLGRILASIYLPKSLRERIPLSNLHTILFNFFGQTSLFKTGSVTKALSTFVVSASVSDTAIENLAEPVVITLQHVEGNQNYDQVHCAFWDLEGNNGQGGWNSSGCKVKETNVNHTICQCDHLTHFGVLMDLSRSAMDAVNERILVLITYIGCGISSIFLGVAIVTYIAFRKLRKDHPSKILINLCTALLMLNLTFLVNAWSSAFQEVGLCVTAAVALHYFLLVSLTWMGLEGVHMYLSLVRVFNIYVRNYILKFCLVGWGIPGIMVAVTLSVKKDLYGTLSSTTPFCWIKDDSTFYTSVVAYFCLIFLMNLSMFCTVLVQLNSMNSQSRKTRRKTILRDLKGTMSLTFLLGLTWGFAFFAWGPVRILFLYLFAIFNTLQGFLIFVFYCLMKESVREQWRIHLCCGWLRLDNSSDGDSRCGLHVGYKQERLKKTFQEKLLTPSLKSTATSSTLKSLGSGQCTLSEISFPNGDFDEDPYCFSPLSCEVEPNYVGRILPVEVKMNSTHKDFWNNSQQRHPPPPSPRLGKMLSL